MPKMKILTFLELSIYMINILPNAASRFHPLNDHYILVFYWNFSLKMILFFSVKAVNFLLSFGYPLRKDVWTR
jgi:hypothetical protein